MPIAALAEVAGGRFAIRGMVLTPDGTRCYATRLAGRPAEALKLAEQAADELLTKAGPEFLSAL
jgi:hydroxymethylbilane synthase